MATYTDKKNAIRAARKALGSDATPGLDFTITVIDGKFGWTQAKAPKPKTPQVAPLAAMTALGLTPPPAPKHRTGTKQELVTGMLTRPEGCTNAEVMEATGWLAHTATAFIYANLKKRGYVVTKEKIDGVNHYHAVPRDQAKAA